MKSLLLILASLIPLLPAAPGAARRREARGGVATAARGQKGSGVCPTVTVSCADNLMLGLPSVFTANVSGGDENVIPSFSWKVSAGTITSDQGTSVVVDTTDLPRVGRQPLKATVDVGGFAQGCQTKASCTTDVTVIIDNFAIDEYGDIRFSDEKSRLDNFAIELRNTAEMSGYIICYGGRKGVRGEAKARCERAKKYLVNRRNIEPGKLLTFDGGFMEDLSVILWLLPPNTNPPITPTVDPSEVQFIEGARKQKGRAPRRRRPGA